MKLKWKKYVIVSILLVVVLLGLPAQAIQFSDVNREDRFGWAYDYVMDAAEKGIFTGYPDGTFKPGSSLTYLEGMKLVSELRPLSPEAKSLAASEYSNLLVELDVPTWAAEAIVTNLFHGVTNESELRNAHALGLFQPNASQNADRVFLAVTLARALELDQPRQGSSLIYTDTNEISERFRPSISALVEIGILNPQGRDGKFEPNSDIMRCEVAKMMMLAYDYLQFSTSTSYEDPYAVNIEPVPVSEEAIGDAILQ